MISEKLMAKPQTDKECQKRNPDKVKKYTQKYLEDKERVSVVLNKATLAKIDKVKPVGQKYSTWLKNLVEEWEKTQNTP